MGQRRPWLSEAETIFVLLEATFIMPTIFLITINIC